jgi:hypothetical protein
VQNLNILLELLLGTSAECVLGSGLLRVMDTQNEEQNASPEQQTSPASQGQASSSAAILHIVTGRLVRNGHGYSLMTENSSCPIETERDLAQYVNKQIIVTGIPNITLMQLRQQAVMPQS